MEIVDLHGRVMAAVAAANVELADLHVCDQQVGALVPGYGKEKRNRCTECCRSGWAGTGTALLINKLIAAQKEYHAECVR